MRRSATVSRRSNRTLAELWPNHHCGYFCNGRFHVRLSVQHSCICIHKTNTERQLLTTQVLIGQNSRKYYRCPCRDNQTVSRARLTAVLAWRRCESLRPYKQTPIASLHPTPSLTSPPPPSRSTSVPPYKSNNCRRQNSLHKMPRVSCTLTVNFLTSVINKGLQMIIASSLSFHVSIYL